MRVRDFAMMMLLAVLALAPHRAAWAQDTAPAAAPQAEENEAALQTVRDIMTQAKNNVATQEAPLTPVYPPIIENAAKRGAQIQFIGERGDFTGWVVLERGTPSYMYVSRDNQTVFQGLMFDGQGVPVTLGQVAEAQMRNPQFFDAVPEDASQQAVAAPLAPAPAVPAAPIPGQEQSAGQVLYNALSVSNFITLGNTEANAPVLYAFIDPECQHCDRFLKEIDQEYLVGKKLQLRAVPIGLQSADSAKKAAYLLSLPNGGDALMAQVRGEKALPVVPGITLDGQQLNIDLFQLWKFDGTPVLVFKAKDGQIMMVRGEPKNMKSMFDMIAQGGA